MLTPALKAPTAVLSKTRFFGGIFKETPSLGAIMARKCRTNNQQNLITNATSSAPQMHFTFAWMVCDARWISWFVSWYIPCLQTESAWRRLRPFVVYSCKAADLCDERWGAFSSRSASLSAFIWYLSKVAAPLAAFIRDELTPAAVSIFVR